MNTPKSAPCDGERIDSPWTWPPSGSSRVLVALGAAAGFLASACASPSEPVATDVSLYALTTAIDGTSFLPPLGPELGGTSGAFDPTLPARLQIVLEDEDGAAQVRTLATFSGTTQPRLALLAEHELYWMNVPAATYFTDPAKLYRFRVLLDGREIGRSDMSSKIFEVLRYVPTVPVGVKLRIDARLAPSLDGLAPSAVEGTSMTLTLTGRHFTRDAVVHVAGHELPATFVSDTELTVVLSEALLAAAGTLDVFVTVPNPGGGASRSVPLTVNHPAPILTALVPASASSGTPNLVLTVHGSGFVEGALISFAGTTLDTTFVSTTELYAGVPSALLRNTGVAAVSVANPSPSLPAAGTAAFPITSACGNGLLDPGETCDGDCPTATRPMAWAGGVSVTNEGRTVTVARTGCGAFVDAETVEAVTSGRHYWEVRVDALYGQLEVGVNAGVAEGFWYSHGLLLGEGVNVSGVPGFAAGDVLGFALDTVAGTLDRYKNGVRQDLQFTHLYRGRAATFISSCDGVATVTANFGQAPFVYPVPAGFDGGTSGGSSCDDGDACTTDALTGDAATCSAACGHQPITACASGDGCCPAGCTSLTDDDCAPTYGWSSGSWGSCPSNPWVYAGTTACSASCGAGTQTVTYTCSPSTNTQTRTVTCLQEGSIPVADSYCTGARPASSQSCTQTSCSGADPSHTQSCSGACTVLPATFAFGTESQWTQGNASTGTDFGGGAVLLHATSVTAPTVWTGGSSITNSGRTVTVTRSACGAGLGATSAALVTSGKPYWEVRIDALSGVTEVGFAGSGSSSYGYWYSGGLLLGNGVNQSSTQTFAAGNVLGFALDTTLGTLSRYRNGVLQSVQFTNTYQGRASTFISDCNGTSTLTANFGQAAFAYAVPTGYTGGLGALTSTYPTTAQWLTSSNTNHLGTANWYSIVSATTSESTPTGSTVRYLVSFNGRGTWKYWSGSSWVVASGGTSDLQTYGMTKTTLEGITEAQWSGANGFTPGTLDVAIGLYTSNSANTPQVSNLTFTHRE